MKIAIIALLITAIVCQAPTPAVNTLDTCLKQVKSSMHEAAVATQLGLAKNWLDMAKDALETGADAIQSYEDCRNVDISAVLAWISTNTSAATQACLGDMIMLYGSLQAAVKDMKAGAATSVILADWSAVSQSLDAAAQGCIPN
jgi:hypothetical protein